MDATHCPVASLLAQLETKGLSDEELVYSLRNAETRQTVNLLFEEIFERYHTRVVNWCYAVARDRDLSRDLAQEVFLKIYRNLHAFRGDSRMSTWIYVITRNHCLNSLRKQDAEPTDSAAPMPLNLEGQSGMEAHQALEEAEAFANVYRAISGILTPLELRILWLHYGNDITLSAITRQLLLSNRSGAKAFIVSARRKLKLYLHNRGLTPESLKSGWVARGLKSRDMSRCRAVAA